MTGKLGLMRIGIALVSASVLVGIAGAANADTSLNDQRVATSTGRTVGLALTGWRNGFVETPEYEECGGSLDPGPVAQMRATPGAIERIMTQGGTFEQYGPNGETPHNNPLALEDALPVPALIATTGFGVNLDGTLDGRETAITRRHTKFRSVVGNIVPEGEPIDNELARVLGCVQGYRSGGQTAEYYNNEIAAFAVNRQLIEIRGVDDEANDPSVDVYFYKGYDRLTRTADGRFMAGLSQRIDTRYPQYNLHTTGRIVDGILITAPISEARLPHSSQQVISDRVMRDMRVHLRLTSDGAEGILAGYDNWRRLWNYDSRRVTHELNKSSAPTMYRRFVQYADAYPDPETGDYTHISAAYRVTAVRAIIVHPAEGETAQREMISAQRQ